MPQFSGLPGSTAPVAWVVGGASGLRTQVCELLLSLNAKVVCVDDMASPLPPLPHPSYIIYFSPTTDNLLSVLEHVGRDIRIFLNEADVANAKFLLVGRNNVATRFARRLVDASKIDKRVVIIEEVDDSRLLPEEAAKNILAALFGFGTRGRVFTQEVPPPKVPKIQAKEISRRGAWAHKKRIPAKKIKLILLSLFLAFLVAAVPFFLMLSGGILLSFGVREIKRGDFGNSQKLSSFAEPIFGISHRIFRGTASLPLAGSLFVPLAQAAYTGQLASESLIQASFIGFKGREIIVGIFGAVPDGTLPLSPGQFIEFSKQVEALAVTAGFLEAHVKENKLLGIGENYFLLPSLFRISEILKEFPDLLGFDGNKTYLVLFQNNMELRPTGGFIGSFGLFTFERGRLVDMGIHDVYEADGQLRGHVEPPEKLKEHLGEASWYLRDSNWSPDFPVSARRAEWFLNKEIGRRVDGVVAVDLEFAKRLLNVIGAVEVTDFGEKVTLQNFYEVTQRRAEVGFFPGSTQKADFITALNRALVQEISSGIANRTVPLTSAILTSLEERDMLVFLHDKEAQAAISELGWDGGVKSVSSCQFPVASCLEDYLMVVEANVGVNKANYLLSRKFVMDVKIDNLSLSHKLKVSYVNNGNERYKAYLRLYLSKGVNGVTSDLTLDALVDQGKDVFGTLVEVPPNDSLELDFSWNLPVTNKESALTFLWQKQSGTVNDPVVLRFRSEDKKLTLTPMPSLTSSKGVGYTTTLRQDLETQITWTDQN